MNNCKQLAQHVLLKCHDADMLKLAQEVMDGCRLQQDIEDIANSPFTDGMTRSLLKSIK